MNPISRNRGRILTPAGLSKLQQAIREWEVQHNLRCTQEKIKELTAVFKEGGLDLGTIRKILEARKPVDPKSIAVVFQALGLQLDESGDLVAPQLRSSPVDPSFLGRETAIVDLDVLVSRGAKVIAIQARGGVGKTTLARRYLQQEFGTFVEFPIAKETKDIASIESLIEEKLRQLGEEPGREFLVSLDRLKRKLQTEAIGILIDNLEPALDSAGKFIEPHRRYVELLRVLVDPTVRSTTLITTRERVRESSFTVEHYTLRGLDVLAWKQFFQNRNLPVDSPALEELHNAYGGNAKAMDIISSAIVEDFAGDIEAYWQANQDDLFIERDLEDLITNQFNRIQQLDLNAYKLLCRMGCYRYQDVPTVPIEGLFCLLWDVPKRQHRRVVKSLQDRSLVSVENGEYWLHSVIRAEALERLKDSGDRRRANREAAEFWTTSVTTVETTEDAQKALEAFYHYVDIQQFDCAADVIIKRRKNKWGTNESLGRSFYKRGLIKQVGDTINAIKDELENGYRRAKIYHILGSTYWLSDNIGQALTYCNKARSIARAYLRQNQNISSDEMRLLQLIEINALLTIGICQIGLGEYKTGLNIHRKVEYLCRQIDDSRYVKSVLFYIAYLSLRLGDRDEAYRIVEELYQEINQLTSRELPSWVTEYRLFYLGLTYKELGMIERAQEIYKKAIWFAGKSPYGQAHAKCLYGQAILDREEKNFEVALPKHEKAIEYLQGIGAKYDLAEAYYQLGLTQQANQDLESSAINFQKAIQLFSEMKAPKQVEKVRNQFRK